jgi:hypothetical protein
MKPPLIRYAQHDTGEQLPMDKTTPHCHAETFAAFVERDRKKIAEAQSLENTDDGNDLDDAWEQYEEETAAARSAGKRRQSATDWINDFEPRAESETGDQDLAEAPHEAAPEPEPQRSVGEVVEEAIRVAGSRRELRQDCPSFWINKKLANCREIRNDTELKAIGLLNSLMQKHGYAYVSNEQFAVWMRMKNSESARHLLTRLAKQGLIENIDRRRDRIKWVVRQDLQNPKRAGSKSQQ